METNKIILNTDVSVLINGFDVKIKNLYEQKHVSNPPEKQGWYHTSKGYFFYFLEEKTWSCRDDQISEEYPEYWYNKV